MDDITKALGILLVAVLAFALFIALPVMWLWNFSLVGTIDGIHEISFAKAIGLSVLLGLLTHKPSIDNQKLTKDSE